MSEALDPNSMMMILQVKTELKSQMKEMKGEQCKQYAIDNVLKSLYLHDSLCLRAICIRERLF